MANLFTAEQIAFLDKRYARIPHDHTWEQVKDTDGQTVGDAFEAVDAAIEELLEDDGGDEGEPIDLDGAEG